MELIYRTKDGKEFYSVKQAYIHEEELEKKKKDNYKKYTVLINFSGFFKVSGMGGCCTDLDAARYAANLLDDGNFDFGDLEEISNVSYTVFDENEVETTFEEDDL